MADDAGQEAKADAGIKRRGLLQFGTLITAFTGASAISALGANTAQAAPGDKNPQVSYVPIVEKGAPSGVATLDSTSKVPLAQVPDLSDIYARQGDLAIRPEDSNYGAKGDGLSDDTAALRGAFNAANARARVGLIPSIKHPGATVILTGTYNLSSLKEPIDIECNVESSRATLLIPATYPGVAVRVGDMSSGGYFQSAYIDLPDVIKPTNSAIVPGSVGVRVQNLGSSTLNFGRTYYHETGIHFTGYNQGTVYNQISIGHISYCKVALMLKPDMPGGWVNQNVFTAGGIQQSVGYAGGIRKSGWRHLVLDGNDINAVGMNTFIGVSFEGDVSEYALDIRQAGNNMFIGCRHEQGTLGVATTVSGSVLTSKAHGLAIGDMVTFSAVTTPEEMFLATPYYVCSVPTGDTFTVSLKKGSTGVSFISAGSGVKYFRPQRILMNTTGGNASNNSFLSPFTIHGVLEVVDTVNSGSGNTVETPEVHTADNYLLNDLPPYRARNRAASPRVRPLFAAYPASNNPAQNPHGWTAALSDRGLVFAASETETGLIANVSGSLTYRRPADTVAYEIPSVRRSPTLITVSFLSCPPNNTTTTTIPLKDAAVNDHVLVTMLTHTPGLVLSHAYVSSANTLTAVFANLTSTTITLNTTLQAMVIRRHY